MKFFSKVANWFRKIFRLAVYEILDRPFDIPATAENSTEPLESSLESTSYVISGFADCPNAEIHLTGYFGSKVAEVTKADSKGFYSFSNIPNGAYVVTPFAPKPGKTFLPEFRAVVVAGADVLGVDFIDPTSVVDSRVVTATTPNSSRNIQGTLHYDVPKADSRAVGAPSDCRAGGAPQDSRVSAPQNSRK